MPSRPSISFRVAASSLSSPFMNFAAKPSMFFPRVTSVTLEAFAASSFSTGDGSGNAEFCAIAGATAIIPTKTSTEIGFFIRISLLFLAAVARRQPLIHFVERVIRDSQCRQYLVARSLALPLLFHAMPRRRSADHSRQHDGCGNPLPPHNVCMPALRCERRSLLHQPALQARWRRPALQRLPHLLFKPVHRLMLHGCTPSIASSLSLAAVSVRVADDSLRSPEASPASPQSLPASGPPGSEEPAPLAAARAASKAIVPIAPPAESSVPLPASHVLPRSPPRDPRPAPAACAEHPSIDSSQHGAASAARVPVTRSLPGSGPSRETHPGRPLLPAHDPRSCAMPARKPSTGARPPVSRNRAARRGP